MRKFQKRVEELNAYRFCDMQSIAPFVSFADALDDDDVHCKIPEALYTSTDMLQINDYFIGRDRYLWLYKDVALPPCREGYDVVGVFDFGKTGDGATKGFESLLYLDGHPYQGVDTNHPDVVFNDYGGKEVRLTFLLWTGLEGGGAPQTQRHLFRCAEVGYLHKAADELYYYARAVTQTLEYLSPDDPAYAANVAAMEAALQRIDWDAESFYGTVDGALACLKQKLREAKRPTGVAVSCVGHTHIDVAWLWRLKHTREKAMRSFATVNRLMSEFDDYHFLQSQPQLYEYIREDQPEIYRQIHRRVEQGLWEPDGGMWLEADCNLPSGESLIRQLVYGTRYIEREFHRDCAYLWLPDVFGYSWALPQILNGCNIRTFMTTKISWNQYNTIPNDLFWWKGIDGSRVLTYFLSAPLDGDAFGNRFVTYNGLLTPHSVLGSWKKFKNKDVSRETLIAYGYGDGGGGVNRDMLKLGHAMQDVPGLPEIRFTSARDFFDRLHESVETTDGYVPTWDGELYLELHRGTYTSQGANKRNNRLYENRLMRSEWLSVLAMLQGGAYEADMLDACWKTVLRNQFHDIIPGSAIHEVYQDSGKEYAEVGELLDRVDSAALETLLRPAEDRYTVINDGSFGGRRIARLPADGKAAGFQDGDGRRLSAQKVAEGWLVDVELAPLSMKTVAPVYGPAETAAAPFAVDMDGRTLDTPFYHMAWEESGRLTRLLDKENDREVLAGKGNALHIFEDRPCNFDAWDIDLFYMQKEPEAPSLQRCVLKEIGPLCCVLRFEYRYRRSVLRQDMVVYAHSRRIDFVTEVDWRESHRLLKASFPVDIRSTRATYDIQCGHVERPTHYNTSWDYARFEVCAHKWADLSDDSYGVSLLNDCKYGYNIYGNEMNITLLKSAKEPDYAADMGVHHFTYALLPHAGTVTQADTISESHFLNRPLTVASGESCRTPLFSFEGNIVIDALKKACDSDDLVVRFHECHGGRTHARLRLPAPINGWTVCNMLEQDTGERVPGDQVELVLRPFEIVTVKLHLPVK
ncbi:MAG TPA: alpha-mannosidase [Firmicutes bacterium]|nr:alpha-mannosidase [Bacillota bacterium]